MRQLFIASSKPSLLFIPAVLEAFDDIILEILRQRFAQDADSRKNVIVHPWLTEVEVDNSFAEGVEILEHVGGVELFEYLLGEGFYFSNIFQSLLLFFDGIRDHYIIKCTQLFRPSLTLH